MGEGYAFEFRQYVGEFRLVGLEEFSARGNVEEQVTHGEVGSDGAAHGRLLLDFACIYVDGRAEFFAFCSGAEFNLRYGCNRSKCFTTESHGAESEEVCCFFDF